MKQFLYGAVLGLIVILGIVTVLTVNAKKTRQAEVDDSLPIAVENAIEVTMNEKSYTIENNEEFIADFTQHLIAQISNDSDIEVDVAKADYEKGILSIKVVETFKHPNGKEGKNECETTAIFEHVPTDAELVNVTYLLDTETIYKQYQIKKGDEVVVPKAPQVEGKTFVGWQENAEEGVKAITGTVESDITYLAKFN